MPRTTDPISSWLARSPNRRVHQNTDGIGADCTLIDRSTTPTRAVVGVGMTLGEATQDALRKWLCPDSYLVMRDDFSLVYEVPTPVGVGMFTARELARVFIFEYESAIDDDHRCPPTERNDR